MVLYLDFFRIENSNFTKSETQAFTQLCRVIILDFLPFVESCLKTFFPKDKVQTIVSRTSLMEKNHSRAMKVGIEARTIAEPLRVLVPELFDEIEKEEMLKSMTDVQRLLGEAKEVDIDTTGSLLPGEVQDQSSPATVTLDSSLPSNEKKSDDHSDGVITETLTGSVPPVKDTMDSLTGSAENVTDGGSGWGDFGFDNDKNLES